MNGTPWITAGLLSLVALVATRTDGPDREPPDRLYLTHAGERIDVEFGEPFSLSVGGQRVELRLDIEPTRVFETDAFQFDYPRHMAYAYDAEEPKSWDLDGTDAVLMLQLHQTDADGLLEALVAGMAEMWGDAFVSERSVRVDLGGKRHRGTRLIVEVGEPPHGQRIAQDLVVIPAGDRSWVLILQDSLNDDGSATAEMNELRELLARTWKAK